MIYKKHKLYFGTGLSAEKEPQAFENLVRTCLENGICCFDTAPSYKMEGILGDALKMNMKTLGINRNCVFVQTKIDAWQMLEGNIKSHINNALESMGLNYFDSVLIHWPVPDYFYNTWYEMKKIRENGVIRSIGVCNVRTRHMLEMLAHDVKPDIVQVERHPLFINQKIVDLCHENKIIVQAYSPLCKMNEKISNNSSLNEMSKKYKKSIGQIILRWHIDTGVTPIFTTKKMSRIEEYADVESFILEQDDVKQINKLNIDYKMYLESWACPGF